MSGKFFDRLFSGAVSRRSFLEKTMSAAAALPLAATPLAAAVAQKE